MECSEPGCVAKPGASGLCSKHYQRARAAGKLVGGAACSVPGCDRTVSAKGFCYLHWRRQRKGRPMAPGLIRERCGDTCSFAGCLRPPIAKRLCAGHWSQQHEGRELSSIRPRGQKWKNRFGYIMVAGHQGHPNATATGAILEHRLVMAQFIGRPLTDAERVHHKNGDRTDNRIENLELWNTSQPPGQRIEDKVRWAMEILAQYKPEVLADEPLGLRA